MICHRTTSKATDGGHYTALVAPALASQLAPPRWFSIDDDSVSSLDDYRKLLTGRCRARTLIYVRNEERPVE